jgi:hypothetical protein
MQRRRTKQFEKRLEPGEAMEKGKGASEEPAESMVDRYWRSRAHSTDATISKFAAALSVRIQARRLVSKRLGPLGLYLRTVSGVCWSNQQMAHL